MSEDKEVISVICGSAEDNTSYSGLHSDYNLAVYDSVDSAFTSEDFSHSQVVVLDIDGLDIKCAEIIEHIKGEIPEVRIIVVWNSESMVLSKNLSRVFFFIKKPFSEDKLSAIIERALCSDHSEERRKEPRFSVELPVDLMYRSRMWPTTTTDISLHGLQVVWPEKNHISNIIETFNQGDSPVSGCRLFLAENKNIDAEHLNLPVSLRYILLPKEVTRPVLMGLEFGSLDFDLRKRIYTALSSIVAEQ